MIREISRDDETASILSLSSRVGLGEGVHTCRPRVKDKRASDVYKILRAVWVPRNDLTIAERPYYCSHIGNIIMTVILGTLLSCSR
jgi:hypothetical protein